MSTPPTDPPELKQRALRCVRLKEPANDNGLKAAPAYLKVDLPLRFDLVPGEAQLVARHLQALLGAANDNERGEP